MMSEIHPAHRMPFLDLVEGLREATEAKLISERADGDLRLYCYTSKCVYDRAWNDITLAARGLIINRERVVATPFPKFFNVGERGDLIPDLGFDVFEKLDGSLIIIWCDAGRWRCATKGSFDSVQAKAAERWLAGRDLSALRPGATYLAEYVAPDNRIVVSYRDTELVLLAIYEEDGNEPLYPIVETTAARLGWRAAPQHSFASVSDLIAHADTLPVVQEGFVLRFSNGLRLKVKGAEYRRVHSLISHCTPLAMWAVMEANDDLIAIRKQLPEEFWSDFDAITTILDMKAKEIVTAVQREAEAVSAWSDKEVGLRLGQWPEPIRAFIFPYRKNAGDLLNSKSRRAIFRAIRPTGNSLDGYTPSYVMNRVLEDAL